MSRVDWVSKARETVARSLSEKVERLSEKLDGPVALVEPRNVEWFTGFRGRAVYIDDDNVVLVASKMERPAVREWPVPDDVEVIDDPSDLKPARVVDSRKACDVVPVYRPRIVTRNITKARLSKTEPELELLRDLVERTVKAFEKISPPEGPETEVELELRRDAASDGLRPSFDPIVAYDRAAGVPHHVPSPVEGWEEVALIDHGLKCYLCTDVTRVWVKGSEAERVADLVSEALDAALDALKPGADPKEVSEEAEKVLRDAPEGYEFLHSLGHHVGVTVHEARFDEGFPEKCVITVEPGLYSERLGVRIEEMVVVKEKGPEVLTEGLPRVMGP